MYWITSTTSLWLINNFIYQVRMFVLRLWWLCPLAVEWELLIILSSGCWVWSDNGRLTISIILYITVSCSCSVIISLKIIYLCSKLIWFLLVNSRLLKAMLVAWTASLPLPEDLSRIRAATPCSATAITHKDMARTDTTLKTFIAIIRISSWAVINIFRRWNC